MDKMIGKPVSSAEFEKVLARQAERGMFIHQIEEELKALRPGECLLYEFRPEAPLWASIGLTLLIGKIKDLKDIREENRVYVYKE